MANHVDSDTISALKPYLKSYLEMRGVRIDGQGWFKCIHPDHKDTSPSMHLDPHCEYQRAKCFSCGANVDIFSAASYIEGRPEGGAEWVVDNVHYLAKIFNVPFVEKQLTEEEIRYLHAEKLYSFVASELVKFAELGGTYTKYAESRGLTKATCVEYGVVSVDWAELAASLVANNFDLHFCETLDIKRDMFDHDRLTFTLRNHKGKPIGFARRFLDYKKEEAKAAELAGRYYPAKYYNTSSDVPFFNKKSFLYGLHTAKGESYKRLDVFEGYIEVLIAKQMGLRATVAACSVALTQEHLEVLKNLGFGHVNLVFDADARGISAAKKYLYEYEDHDVLVTATFLPFDSDTPEDQRDPDVFLLKNGIEKYLQVTPETAFESRLKDLKASSTGSPVSSDVLLSMMLPKIVKEGSRLRQDSMIKALAMVAGVSPESVKAEVDSRTDRKVLSVSSDLVKRLTQIRDSKDVAIALNEAIDKIGEVGKEDDADLSFEECLMSFCDVVQRNETHKVGLAGWDTGWPQFNENFDGLPKTSQIIGVAGASNCGKSAWVTTLATNLMIKNENGPVVVYHVLDDPRPVAYAKLLSCLTGLPIKYIVKVEQYMRKGSPERESYEAARDWLKKAIVDKRLIVKGQEIGNNTKVTEMLIDRVIAESGREVVYIGDSLHSLDDLNSSDERIRFKRVAEWTMKITETKPITMVFTVELNKLGMDGRPKLSTLAESGKLIYALKAIGMFYNELHDKGLSASNFWVEETKDATGKTTAYKRPIIEIQWAKNKISEFKGTTYQRFYDNVARIEELTIEDLKKERENAKKLLKDQQPNDNAIGSLSLQQLSTPKGFFVP